MTPKAEREVVLVGPLDSLEAEFLDAIDGPSEDRFVSEGERRNHLRPDDADERGCVGMGRRAMAIECGQLSLGAEPLT
jgi:hypothetical protein